MAVAWSTIIPFVPPLGGIAVWSVIDGASSPVSYIVAESSHLIVLIGSLLVAADAWLGEACP